MIVCSVSWESLLSRPKRDWRRQDAKSQVQKAVSHIRQWKHMQKYHVIHICLYSNVVEEWNSDTCNCMYIIVYVTMYVYV